MKNEERAALLRGIAALCERYPHWRFGQLVANVAGWADQEIWDVEDEQLLAAARAHLAQLTSPMRDDLNRVLQKAGLALLRTKEEKLAAIRQYYYSLDASGQQRFKDLLLKVAD